MSVAFVENQRMAWTRREAHNDHSLMFLGPKDYRGLGDKIVSVSVKPLTQG